MKQKLIKITVAALALGATASVAMAITPQQKAQYLAAKKSGLIGEKMDGEIGTVSAPSAGLKSLVDAINIERKAVYLRLAKQQGVRPADAGVSAGCNQIKKTKPGEYYQAPAGNWVQRTAGAPQLNAVCPK